MSLTLTYDGVLSRVRISATGIPAAAVSVTVERSTNQVNWTTVRGGGALVPAAGVIALDDYEFAADVANHYRVRAYTAAGREVGPTVNANPFLETSASGWTGVNATIARSTVQAHEGAASLLITPDGVSASGGANGAARAAVTGTRDYLGGLWVFSPGGHADLRPCVDWFTATSGGSFISTSLGTGNVVAAGGWTYLSAIYTAPGTAAGGVMRARHGGTPAAGATWYADEIQLNALDVGPIFTGSVAPALDGVWIKSVSRPFLNRQVIIQDYSDVERQARAGVFDVIGRSYPVAVNDVRGSKRWTLDVLTETLAEASDLDMILASGDPIYIHVPADCPVPGGYVTVGDTRQARTARRSVRRITSMPCTEVAAPGPDVVGATVNWQTVLGAYATWADLLAAHPTWASVLELIGSPTDVVVP